MIAPKHCDLQGTIISRPADTTRQVQFPLHHRLHSAHDSYLIPLGFSPQYLQSSAANNNSAVR